MKRALARPYASTTDIAGMVSHDPACALHQRDATAATWPNMPTLSGRFTPRWRGYIPHASTSLIFTDAHSFLFFPA